VETRTAEFGKFESSSAFSAREKLALRYASAIMWNPTDADDAMWKALHAQFTEPQLVELGYWIGFTFGGQRWLHTLNASQGELDAFLATRAAARPAG
jgi:alkylhydroperoxidase family enzyme